MMSDKLTKRGTVEPCYTCGRLHKCEPGSSGMKLYLFTPPKNTLVGTASRCLACTKKLGPLKQMMGKPEDSWIVPPKNAE